MTTAATNPSSQAATRRRPVVVAAAALACLASAAGCDQSKPASGPTGSGPLYAVMYEIFDDISSTSYLATFNSLDIQTIDQTKAREFPGGRAYLQTFNGWLFVGEPASPIVRRYAVGADGALSEDGTISFANFGLEAGTIDPWSLTFISQTKAYLFDFKEGTHIIWNPTTMEIVGEIAPQPEFTRAGFSLDGSPAVLRGNRLFRSVFWANFDTATYSPDHLLAIYDVESDKLIETVPETRCPAPGNLVHQDEEGNFYFSNWIWPVAGTLMHGAPKSCVLRLGKDATRFDPSWTLPFHELTGGHEGAVFSYLGGGQGLMAVFDDSRISFDPTTDPWEYAGSANWSIWTVDLQKRTAAPVEDIPLNAGAYTPSRLDGRTLLMVPKEGWSASEVYEIKNGRGVRGVDVPGWSYALVKVR